MKSQLAELILQAIRTNNGEWVSRNDIASLIGRSRGLLPHDVELLNGMVESGEIEVTRVPRGLVGYRFEYRVKES